MYVFLFFYDTYGLLSPICTEGLYEDEESVDHNPVLTLRLLQDNKKLEQNLWTMVSVHLLIPFYDIYVLLSSIGYLLTKLVV